MYVNVSDKVLLLIIIKKMRPVMATNLLLGILNTVDGIT